MEDLSGTMEDVAFSEMDSSSTIGIRSIVGIANCFQEPRRQFIHLTWVTGELTEGTPIVVVALLPGRIMVIAKNASLDCSHL